MIAPETSALSQLMRRAKLALTRPDLVADRVRRIVGIEKVFAAPTSTDNRSAIDFELYRTRCRELGLTKPLLFLSFDCDTDLDPPASKQVMAFLDDLSITATFAVPGVMLEHGAAIYKSIADAGSEFMNHGHLPHAEVQGDRWVGITFYETMPQHVVESDIRQGHATVERVIGRAPRGFRAPHFGHYQKPHELALVHSVAQDLGYSYCSTTVPTYALEHGPASRVGSLTELPAFGSYASPMCILDSWTYLTDRKDYALGEIYADLMIETVDMLLAEKLPALLTWYADPAHVAGQAPFERAMRHLAKRGIKSLSGTQAAALGTSVAAMPR